MTQIQLCVIGSGPQRKNLQSLRKSYTTNIKSMWRCQARMLPDELAWSDFRLKRWQCIAQPAQTQKKARLACSRILICAVGQGMETLQMPRHTENMSERYAENSATRVHVSNKHTMPQDTLVRVRTNHTDSKTYGTDSLHISRNLTTTQQYWETYKSTHNTKVWYGGLDHHTLWKANIHRPALVDFAQMWEEMK